MKRLFSLTAENSNFKELNFERSFDLFEIKGLADARFRWRTGSLMLSSNLNIFWILIQISKGNHLSRILTQDDSDSSGLWISNLKASSVLSSLAWRSFRRKGNIITSCRCWNHRRKGHWKGRCVLIQVIIASQQSCRQPQIHSQGYSRGVYWKSATSADLRSRP